MSEESKLRHCFVERGVKLIHRGFCFIAHVGDAERGAFDFSVAAVNQETCVLRQLLQLGHVYRPSAGPGAIADARQRE